MRIAVFTRELDQVLGGMERQLLGICEFFLSAGHQVTVYTLDKQTPRIFYSEIPVNLEIKPLSTSNPRTSSTWLERISRQALVFKNLRIDKPDVGISFMVGAFLYSSIPSKLLGIPVVLAERNSPDIYQKTSVRNKRHFLFIFMLLAKVITVQFPRYSRSYPFYLRHKIRSIPNSVPKFHQSTRNAATYPIFLFAGRFSFQKQVIRLLKAFAIHLEEYPESILKLYGKGEQEEQIYEVIASLNLMGKVEIFPPDPDVRNIFQSGHILCIPSIWEGFPNILAEALSFGLPAIGFSNCDGVSDLITSNENGWLEEDDGSLEPLVKLLNSAATAHGEKLDISESCKASVSEFSDGQVSQKWNLLVANLVRR